MSFRLKTILGIALIESVLLLILIISGMNFLNTSNEAQLKQRVETTSILFANAIKDAVLSTDLATLESFIEEIQRTEDVVYTRISSGGFILAEGGDAHILNQPHIPDDQLTQVKDGIYDIQIEITEGNNLYGVIEMGISTKSIELLFAQAQRWTIAIAGLEVILVAIFSFILGTLLTQQLLKLKKASETIAQSGPGLQVKVKGKDEIAEVTRAFNHMSSTLEISYDKLSRSIEAERAMTAIANNNQAKNNAILTSSLDALITIDEQGKVIDYNDIAALTFGWDYDEIIGQILADFIIPAHKRNAHLNGIKNYLTTKNSPVINKRLELTAQHKLGHHFPIEINIAPIETQQGTLFTAFIRDITSRLEAETELRLAAQTFESSEAIFICTADNRIIRANYAFTRITGYNSDEILGQDPRILSSGKHDKKYYQAMWSTLLKEGKWSGEIYNKRKNGAIFPEYLNITAVKDSSGKVSHYIAHLIDITEQKHNEKKLHQARLEAEESNKAKSHFLATMSHEIRTPMNAVLGILNLLKNTPLDDKQIELVKTGHNSGELLLTIINDILDFTKLDIDKLQLENTGFDLHELLTNVNELLTHLAQEKGLTLTLSLAADLPQFVKGDPDRIRQILINLINNAIKFTAIGKVEVTATLDSVNENTMTLHCTISDTGIGISKSNQSSLFEEFTMVDQTHARHYEGTGLGLAICKRLVDLMHGNIQVQSELGQGSTFEFTLELTMAKESEVIDEIANAIQQQPLASTRILLAEDNIPNQMVIKNILEYANLNVDIVANGKDAVNAVRNANYDIILMDISMPEMDGMAATQAIRQLDETRCNIPIIALTAHSLSGDKDRFLQIGMNDYLSKPINKDMALSCIARWTDKNKELNTESTAAATTTNPIKPQLSAYDNADYVNESVLQQLVKDTSADIVPELLTFYIEDTQERVALANEAINNQDLATLEFEMHTIGSSAGAHGNSKLHKLARDVELLCKQRKQSEAFAQASLLPYLAQESFRLLTQRIQQGFATITTGQSHE